MLRGIYASTSSLLTLLRRQEAMSHNLANMNTVGFKQEVIVPGTQAAQPVVASTDPSSNAWLVGDLTLGVDGGTLAVDYSQGPLANTGRPLDIAITSPGFFRVQTPAGERLTRDGTFFRDANGSVVTADGYQLLGENGAIQLPDDAPYVAPDGSVYSAGSTTPVARIQLGQVADTAALQAMAGNLLDPAGAAVQRLPAGQVALRQGFLEQANVNLSSTMVSMMLALRGYEATQRALKMQDAALQRTMEVGRVGL